MAVVTIATYSFRWGRVVRIDFLEEWKYLYVSHFFSSIIYNGWVIFLVCNYQSLSSLFNNTCYLAFSRFCFCCFKFYYHGYFYRSSVIFLGNFDLEVGLRIKSYFRDLIWVTKLSSESCVSLHFQQQYLRLTPKQKPPH